MFRLRRTPRLAQRFSRLPDFNGTVELEGLRELRTELRRYSKQAPKVVQAANKEVAQDVVDKSLKKMRGLGGVHAHAARMKSIRPRAGADWAGIVIGGKAKKHGPALGAEFGSKQFRQFPAWRGNDTGAGYAVWPTIRKESEMIRENYIDLLQRALDKGF